MLLPIRKFKVTKQVCSTDEICRTWLAPDDGLPMFEFEAGQFVMLHELDENSKSVYSRSYSIASAPIESKKEIELGVKKQGRLSSKIFNFKPGEVIGVQGPYGIFTLNKNAKQIVFFAGGIGMTPFRSHIRESLLSNLHQNLVLFYSGRTQDDLVYHLEFKELAKKYSNFVYIPITTRECPANWIGECKRLDSEMLDKYSIDLSISEFMACGPLEFMESIKSILTDKGVDVRSRLRLERY